MTELTAGPSPTRRRLLIAVLTLLLVLGVPYLLARTWVQPGAALVKAGFGLGPLVTTAADFPAVRARVAVQRDLAIPVSGAPEAIVDVYTPRAPAVTARPIVLWVHGGGFISGSNWLRCGAVPGWRPRSALLPAYGCGRARN
jgi:acetyl esterase/lipase